MEDKYKLTELKVEYRKEERYGWDRELIEKDFPKKGRAKNKDGHSLFEKILFNMIITGLQPRRQEWECSQHIIGSCLVEAAARPFYCLLISDKLCQAYSKN